MSWDVPECRFVLPQESISPRRHQPCFCLVLCVVVRAVTPPPPLLMVGSPLLICQRAWCLGLSRGADPAGRRAAQAPPGALRGSAPFQGALTWRPSGSACPRRPADGLSKFPRRRRGSVDTCLSPGMPVTAVQMVRGAVVPNLSRGEVSVPQRGPGAPCWRAGRLSTGWSVWPPGP